MGAPGAPADPAHGKNVTIATSTIIASIWAGLWGFNWAASHLQSGQLFVAIMVGLAFGTFLTVYLVHLTFQLARDLLNLPGGLVFTAKATPRTPPT